MALDDVKGMNIAQVIEYYGNCPQSRDRNFFMYYDQEGEFREVSFGRFLEMSLDYARMIDTLRRRQGREKEGRFHVGFYMQNTPEVLYAFGGCAFTNAPNRKAFTRIFGLDIFTEAFGSTEVGAIATVTPDTPPYSVGKYLPGKEIKIVDEFTGHEQIPARVDPTGRILNFDRAVGEIVVSQESLGDSAFTGYYNMPQESAERVDEAGYYHMGDLGAYVELKGKRYILFLGRTGTDRLRSKGENFSTAFIEEIILGYERVVNCVVIGIPHVDSTENDNPIYIVEVEDPPRFNVPGLYGFCRRNVPPYALPGYIRVVAELPKTDTQKVRKSVLLHEFIERTPVMDADENDLIYSVKGGALELFTTRKYRREMDRCTDPMVRSRFAAVTGRQDLFHIIDEVPVRTGERC